MQFRTLEHTPTENVSDTFNKAFEDYEFNMQQTTEAFAHKLMREKIDLSKSVGAFDGDVMVGFILFGVGEFNGILTAWDGGTGVLSAYRGQQLTQKMFAFIQPLLNASGIKKLLLEVLQKNIPAYTTYQKIGFKTTRELLAYKGTVNNGQPIQHKIEVLTEYNPVQLLSLGDWQPCWQQTNAVVKNCGNAVLTIGIKHDDTIVAYAHFNTQTKRMMQFAVDIRYRRQGMATALFQYLSSQYSEPILTINIDGNSTNTNAFLKSIGFEHFTSQHEMEMGLST